MNSSDICISSKSSQLLPFIKTIIRCIGRQHDGLGQPVDLKIKNPQYRDKNSIGYQDQNYSLHPNNRSTFFSSYNHKPFSNYYDKIHNTRHKGRNTAPSQFDFTEKTFLQPLRMLREFRQLLAELFPSERLQQYYFPFGWTRSSYNAFVHGDEGNNNYCPYPRSDSLRTDFSTALPKVSEKDQLLHDLEIIGAELLDTY